MLFGLKGYLKRPLTVEQVSAIIEDCATEYGDLRFDYADRGSLKPRHTKKADEVRKKVAAGKCGILFVSSVRNGEDTVIMGLEGSSRLYLPFDIQAVREVKESELPDVERFFDGIVVKAGCQYAFGVTADTWMEKNEELSFASSRFWSPGMDETETERDRYLRTLNRLERDFGRRIPQLYPINYISDDMRPNVEDVLREFVDPHKWKTTRIDGIAKITFTDLLNRSEFQLVQEGIRKQLWERYAVRGTGDQGSKVSGTKG
jgi:hypothetical protein